jgi:glutamine amidotransferase
VRTLLIDYGMGNLGSARHALELCGTDVIVSREPLDALTVDRLVLPGVGAFGEGMALLRDRGWVPAIASALENPDVRLLGICLGMQFLADKGFEGDETNGLALIPGEVRRLEPSDATLRVPHVGWNEVHYRRPSPLFTDVAAGSDFYFVHSYQFLPVRYEDIIAATPYGGDVVSAVARGNVMGVQFHPEKSARAGLQVLRNFLGSC